MSPLSENSSWLSRFKGYQRECIFKYISCHLIYEILLRTPAESLLVCKSVCKDWYSIIKDPNFVKQHRDYHATKDQSIGLVFISGTRNIFNFDLTIMNKWSGSANVVRILGRGPAKPLRVVTNAKLRVRFVSCNGMVCFYTDYPMHICNPVTREFVTLPKPRPQKGKEERTGCGFGFDATNNEYKAVQIFRHFDDSTLNYEILTLGATMTWRRRIQQKDKLPHPAFKEDEIGQGSIFIEGSLYWHATKYILCFDVTTERFKLIQVPKARVMRCGVSIGYSMLVELDKSLCFVKHDISNAMLHIWKMQKDFVDEENLWKGHSIDVSRINSPDSYIQPVCIRSKKIYLRWENGLACYDEESQEPVAPVFSVGADNGFDFVAYSKNIVCLKDIVGPSWVSSLSGSYM